MGCVLLLLGSTCQVQAAGDSLFHAARPAMGTSFEVYLYAPGRAQADALFEAAFEEIERVEATLSTYRPASELSRINAGAAVAPVTTDPEVFRLLDRALAYSRASRGAFDVSVGRLMKAWGFFRGQGHYPAPEALAEALGQTGWQHVQLEAAARTVRFAVAGLELDLGAVGKGYALDQVAALLRRLGVTAALLGAGASTYYALGAPPGRAGWPVHVTMPHDRSQARSTVLLRDEALSTSGSYEKFFELDGKQYCHIMDPRVGHPVEGMLQVTVVAPRAEDSDALSTALFVLGDAEASLVLADRPTAKVLFVGGTAEAARVVALNWPERLPAAASARQNVHR